MSIADCPQLVNTQRSTVASEPEKKQMAASPMLLKTQSMNRASEGLQTTPSPALSVMMQFLIVGLLDQQLIAPDPQHP